MSNVLMDVQLEEPTIEFVQSQQLDDINTQVSPEETVTAEPFMVVDVPEPTIEMPKLKNNFDLNAYELYLNYQDYLLEKYGDVWYKALAEEEKNTFVDYYVGSHSDTREQVLARFNTR